MTAALVSVVIPAYNAATFLRETVDSVLGQTYPRVECVVVDDGSTDETAEVVSGYGDRVRYVRQDNQGVSSARNNGIRRVSGSLVAFLDSDDIWLPRKLEWQAPLLSEHRLHLVYGGLHLIDEDGFFIGKMEPAAGSDALRNTLVLEKPFMTGIGSTGIVPLDAINAIGGFDERLSVSADFDLACRLAMRGPVDAVPKPVVLYRQHNRQMHLDPSRIIHDTSIAFDKLFSDPALPAELSKLRRRALANLDVSVAGSYLKAGNRRRFARHLSRAFLRSPRRVAAAVARLTAPAQDWA